MSKRSRAARMAVSSASGSYFVERRRPALRSIYAANEPLRTAVNLVLFQGNWHIQMSRRDLHPEYCLMKPWNGSRITHIVLCGVIITDNRANLHRRPNSRLDQCEKGVPNWYASAYQPRSGFRCSSAYHGALRAEIMGLPLGSGEIPPTSRPIDSPCLDVGGDPNPSVGAFSL